MSDSDSTEDTEDSGKELSSSTEDCTGSDLEQSASQSVSDSSVWKTAVCPHSGNTYYYHVVTRETQWSKPIEMASKEERDAIEEKERRQKEFFAAMEANILKSISMGLKIPQKKSLWDEQEKAEVGGEKETEKETEEQKETEDEEESLNEKDIEQEKEEDKREKENENERKKKQTLEEKDRSRFNLVRTISTMDTSILRELIVRVPSTKSLTLESLDLAGDDNSVAPAAKAMTETSPLDAMLGASNHSLDLMLGSSNHSLDMMMNSSNHSQKMVDMLGQSNHSQRSMGLELLAPVRETSQTYDDEDRSDHSNELSKRSNDSNGSLDFSLLSGAMHERSSSGFGNSASIAWGHTSTSFSFFDESVNNFGLSTEESEALGNLAKISKQMARLSQNFESSFSDRRMSDMGRRVSGKGKKRRNKFLDKTKRVDGDVPSLLPGIEDDDEEDDFDFGFEGEDPSEGLDFENGEDVTKSSNTSMRMSFQESGDIDECDSENQSGGLDDGSSMPDMEDYNLEDDTTLVSDSENDEQDVPANPLAAAAANFPLPITTDTAKGVSKRTSLEEVIGLRPLSDQPVKHSSLTESGREKSRRSDYSKASRRASKSYRDLKTGSLILEEKESEEPKKAKKERRRSQLKRRNTCGTLYVGTTMAAPDKDATIKCVCGVFRAHILQSDMLEDHHHPDMYKFRVFNDLASHQTPVKREDYRPSSENDNVWVPSLDEISIFYRDVFRRAQMEADCIIMSLIYVERLVKCTQGALRPRPCNWRSILFCCMVLSSKVWDDMSLWNADFSQTCPNGVQFTLKRINELEVALLSALQYKVKVTASEYAKYYFLMRSMLIKSGLVSGDVVDSKAPLDVEGAKRLQQVSAEFQKKGGVNRRKKALKERSKSLDATTAKLQDSEQKKRGRKKNQMHLEDVVNM